MTLKKSHSQWLRIVFRHSVKWDPFNHFNMSPQVDYCNIMLNETNVTYDK